MYQFEEVGPSRNMYQWEIEDFMCSYLGLVFDLVTEFVKIKQVPTGGWRHACFTKGVTLIEPIELVLPDEKGVVTFIYCESCGNIYYFLDKGW